MDRRHAARDERCASPPCGRSSGSTATATATATASSSTRGARRAGLDNQSWKDSDDSQRFADGRVAEPPIAPCEVQGYVFDAKQRMAEIAREVWRDRELGDRLDREAKELRRAFNEAYWIEKRGGYYALALDGDKHPVDSMCSNMGHLLWSGIVPPERADAVVDRADGRGALVGLGGTHDVLGGRGLQPARVPQRHGLAPRQFPDRARACALPTLARGSAASCSGCSRRPRTSITSCRRCSRACRGPRRRSRSRIRPPHGRRRGRPRRRSSCSGCCSASSRRAAAHTLETEAPVELPSWVGVAAAGRRAVLRPSLDGARRRRPRQGRARMRSRL